MVSLMAKLAWSAPKATRGFGESSGMCASGGDSSGVRQQPQCAQNQQWFGFWLYAKSGTAKLLIMRAEVEGLIRELHRGKSSRQAPPWDESVPVRRQACSAFCDQHCGLVRPDTYRSARGAPGEMWATRGPRSVHRWLAHSFGPAGGPSASSISHRPERSRSK
jgi:hypothetical protein